MQSECPYHPLQHMEPLRIHSASGIHLPMQSEYPYRPLKHMEPSRIRSASGLHLPMPGECPYHPLKHLKPLRFQSAPGINIRSAYDEGWVFHLQGRVLLEMHFVKRHSVLTSILIHIRTS